MATSVRLSPVAVMLFVSIACSSELSVPTAPVTDPAPAPSPAPLPSPPTSVPPLSGPSTTYKFSGPLSYPVHSFTERSSFVVYESGAFVLQYESFNPIIGTYQREGGLIIFSFAASNRDAIGTPNGDLLEVRYSDLMQHSDYENAVYRLIE